MVGAGPAGLTLTCLLASAGVRVVLLEQGEEIIGHARAVGIDDEAIRTLQSFGLAETVLADCLQGAPIRYHDSRGRVLAHVAPSARPYGWPRRNLFHQPTLEARLREAVRAAPEAELRTGHEVVGLRQDSRGVVVEVAAGGERSTLRGRFAVGADGGRSFVREAVGIALRGTTAPSKWLVVDVAKDSWPAPYSAVYTSPDRPAMTIPLPFGLRRFEFRIKPEEDPDAFAAEQNVHRLLRRFYPAPAELPLIQRSRVYWHHSRTAERFRAGSVFLAGDAAHLQPPFFGQGMNSGLRDVTNLSWKLTAALAGRGGEELLDSYDRERRPTAEAMVAFATRMGQYYQPRNLVTERVRNALFRGAQRIPGGRDYILQMKYKPVPRYTTGLVLGAAGKDRDSLLGRAFPQPWVAAAGDGRRTRLDDVLGVRHAVLVLAAGGAAAVSDATLELLHANNGVLLQATPPGLFGRESVALDPAQLARGVTGLVDVDGGLRDLLLARPGDEVYVIRPDRYVGAVCRAEDADRVLRAYLARLAS